MALDCKSVWSGALTSTSVRVVADTAPPTNGSLLVADNEAMTGATTVGPVTATINGILDFAVTGLDPDTQYWYVVDAGGLNNSYKGTFRTHPGAVGEPLSYIFGAAGDAGLVGAGDDSYITDQVSNNPVFDVMRQQCVDESWTWFSHLGDLHYRNYNVNDPALFREAYDENHNFNLGFNPGARQGMFLRGQAITYVWDDHDFGGNDSNRTVASNPAANLVYRECVPHYPLAGGSTGIYQSWQVGRVLYVATDSRSFRDPNSDPQGPAKTLLGTAQKQWFENLLLTARDTGAEALVWQSSSRWIGGTDTWSSFEHERAEMVQMFGDTGWLDRMIFMTADEHALSLCSGPYNPYGHFPMFMFASMDSSYGTNSTEIYDVGQNQGRQQYGTMRVADNGHTLSLTGTGYINGQVWKAYTKHVRVGSSVLSLNYAGGHIRDPFRPTVDTEAIVNDVTAQRQGGGEARYTQTTGLRGTTTIGSKPGSVTVEVASDDQLGSQASWRVHVGTSPDARIPEVHSDLAKAGNTTGLADPVASASLGNKMLITNPPSDLPPDDVELIVEGYSETIGEYEWAFQSNATPGKLWSVAQLATPQILVQGDFETSLTGWSANNGSISRVAAPGMSPFGGAWSAQITPNGSSASGGINGPLTAAGTVIPGEQYIASCWVYSPGGWSDIQACVDWHNAAGTFLSSGLGSGTAVPAGQWTLLTQTLTAPANASRLVPRARHGGTPAAGNIWHADQITVREARATGYSAGPNRPNRLDTSACQLVTAVTSSGTSFTVHTPPDGIFPRAPWIISTGLASAPNLKPTQFPFDVHLGGEVARVTACAPGAWDDFARTTSNGWGTSSSGGVWTIANAAASDFSTNGSVGLHSLGSVNSSRYTHTPSPAADLDLRIDVATSVLATGGSHYLHLLARYLDVSNMYAARLAFTTTQTLQLVIQKRVAGAQTDLVTVTVPGVHAAATFYTVRFQLAGTTLRAKAWRVGQAEPEKWQAIVTDTSLTAAGSVGVRSVLDGANTNPLPVVFSYDNFEITNPQRMTVTRSINAVAKPQAAGTALSLAQPAPVAL
ncbi:Phosphodiesterase/alkaline phosphatase D [Streptomyces sp. cf386]|uniref:alkaline phosphatase D family protein n=1 Tax=Streptomyces sp. cf386 TaxID=1761904 RepID=UPI00088FC071|nr:alkaline phosphatase D family protein [Streptomyces sp. cf386]SDM46188.1 Phosphodiesterase/alkaline phosphatase D [Streptomyces sp. cf386]